MSSGANACAIHIAVLDIVSVIANFSMIIHIWRTRNNARKVDFLFAALGLSNFALSVFIIFRVVVTSLLTFNDTRTSTIEAFIYGLYGVLSTQNLSLNAGIAYSRFCSVSQPMRYSTGQERSRLQKKLLLIITVISTVFGVAIGLATGIAQSRVVRNWIEASSRFLTYILLCMIYGKIFWKVKVHNQSMINPTGIGSEEENSTFRQAKLNHERYLTRLFLGITISFFVFNLPMMIIGTIIPSVHGCDTVEGKLLTFAVTFVITGMVFDPFWYFFLWRRIRMSQPEQASPQDNDNIRISPS